MSKLKIAVFHNLPSGGALRALKDKIRLFKKLGHIIELYIFSTAENEICDLKNLADRHQTTPLNFRGRGACERYEEATRKTAEAINQSGADLVWVEKCQFFGSPPLLKHLKKKNIFYTHEPLRIREYEKLAAGLSGSSEKSRLRFNTRSLPNIKKIFNWSRRSVIKREDRLSIRAADGVIANSKFTSRWLEAAYGIRPVVGYQGVDSDFFHPPSSAIKKKHFLSVGRLDATKGHDFLLGVFSRIPTRERLPLIFVCDAIDVSYLKVVQTLARKRGVSFEIRQRISDEALRALYWESIAVLSPAVHEPFGLVPLEAMACGIPVIAAREGGFLETVLDGETGFLLQRDEDLWAKKILWCLSHPDSLEKVGQQGVRQVASRWSWDRYTENLRNAARSYGISL